jgi:hypothetical protein
VPSDLQQQLVAERNATTQRLLSLRGVMHTALLARKSPEKVERLQTQLLALRARVRVLDRQIKRQSDVD